MESSTSQDQARKRLRANIWSRPYAAALILAGGLAVLLLSIAVSICVGAKDISLDAVWQALFRFDPASSQHQIIRELRLPRAAAGALAGAAFAAAGAIMQGMTRNPIADTGVLGINAGASLALAVCLAFFPAMVFGRIVLIAFAGAACAALLVFGIGSAPRRGMDPVRMTLAGTAISALLLALSQGISLYNNVSQSLSFWVAGSLAGVKWSQVDTLAVWVGLGLISSLLISRSVTVLSLGEDVASGLGQRSGMVKLGGFMIVLVLAGSSVAAVGPIGFVGLIVPHVARYLVGVDYRWIIPCSAVLGAVLLVLSDIGARLIRPDFETPLGAVVSMLGVPYFLYLIRRETRD
ncbi:iron ABC transporter permease [Paenibacillus sp. JX-17]|uniref:Iron ABC transporter permease n=1 Tax=Paenibacillus lacisoli TaxID=3064525 RepID=A0ABT9CCS1_9BACL|nr:iron ABC transporter permease [Paenibacillus sp. JX-17]MDO7906459.1 iron ABC transporter permease [Paenibacillus sp. JX-17]